MTTNEIRAKKLRETRKLAGQLKRGRAGTTQRSGDIAKLRWHIFDRPNGVVRFYRTYFPARSFASMCQLMGHLVAVGHVIRADGRGYELTDAGREAVAEEARK